MIQNVKRIDKGQVHKDESLVFVTLKYPQEEC